MVSFTLAATGDALIDRPIDGDDDLSSLLQAADATVTQVEPVLTTDCPPAAFRQVPDQYQYLAPFPGAIMRTDPAMLDALQSVGVNLCTTASNHAYDFEGCGVESTIDAFRERDLPFAGIGTDRTAAREPAVLETSGGCVGLVNASASVPPNGAAGVATDEFPGGAGINPLHVERTYRVSESRLEALRAIAGETGIDRTKGEWLRRENPDWERDEAYYFMHMGTRPATDEYPPGIEQSVHDPDRRAILDSIRRAAETTDWVVMALHAHQAAAGDRNTAATPDFLCRFARACIDAGADAFVGTGPHTIRGIELYDGAPIYYSLGNFVFHESTISRIPDTRADAGTSTVPSVRDSDNGDAEQTHDAANWRSIVPVCEFDAGGFQRARLYPCTLQPDSTDRGTPRLATGERARDILETVADLSAEFGTTVRIDGETGIVRQDS